MKIAIVQARLGSKRLPLKSLLTFNNYPLIIHVLERLKKSKLVDKIVVAIPDTVENDLLEKVVVDNNYICFRGSENDVLHRIYSASLAFDASHIIRICADNPFVDPKEVDNLISFFISSNYDYVYNHIPVGNNYPDGLGAEMCTINVLRKIDTCAHNVKHREHCFSYLTDNPSKFSIGTFNPRNNNIAYPNVKLDIDTKDDFLKLSSLNLSVCSSSEEIVNKYLKYF